MRTLIWTSPGGVTKRITIGGRRNRPLSSRNTTSLDAVEDFMALQRARVAQRLQREVDRIFESRADEMERHHALTETNITTR